MLISNNCFSVTAFLLKYRRSQYGLLLLSDILLKIFLNLFVLLECPVMSMDFILISMFLRLCTYALGVFRAGRTAGCQWNQGRTRGEGWSTAGWLKPSSNCIAGRPGAALLFWFFGEFRCGALLFMIILVIYGCGNK